ncbi:MAG: hypothetical protein Q9169_003723 [Polycauliona sp. 2 TL-2023]
MAMNQFKVPDLGLLNATMALGDIPRSRYTCQQFYGSIQNTQECQAAIDKLPTGSEPIDYINDGRGWLYHLPHQKTSRNCMIQLEVAGQRPPRYFRVAPDQIRAMASNVMHECAEGGGHTGGFMTTDLSNMAGWLTSPGGELNIDMPYDTSFLTVSVTTPFPEYISPGNYDPYMASLFAQVEYEEADKMPPDSRMAKRLKSRGDRLEINARLMSPRGRKIPWWTVPPGPPPPRPSGFVEADVPAMLPGNAAQGPGGLAVAENPLALGDESGTAAKPETPPNGETGTAGTATARKARRRRRGGMGEEGLMG